MNKVLYAKEGAKNMMDNTFDYFPWDVKLEIDGSKINIPQVKCIKLLLFLLSPFSSLIKLIIPPVFKVKCDAQVHMILINYLNAR